MDKDGSHMTERLLSLTLEIIYLLTGEDYRPMKRESTDRVTYHKDLNKIQKPLTAPRPERSSQQKILELTNKILELLTGEVPIRCQDVAVYFTMEEWEYIEGHKDLYKDAMMDDHQTLTSADGTGTRRTPKRCPSPPYPLCKEEYDETLPYEDIEMKEVVVGSEFGDDDDEMCTMGDSQCKEEEAPLCIHPGG
ncbi:gastrula zinc finger protein XlCGF66.1-like [Leptodactylus fuscus]|uniref:gastrula zinc finger protein XlCGF66.1-like n=1 Tax=Leptodactylus fuscus TaxID=238119 RepID=UPI003F4E5CB6